jgi:hypothetical protein
MRILTATAWIIAAPTSYPDNCLGAGGASYHGVAPHIVVGASIVLAGFVVVAEGDMLASYNM